MRSVSEIPKPLYLVGPTGSGKTAVALTLAELLPLEIVTADSMQVYKGVDIGTAKPGMDERRRVRHHLIDVAEPSESFDVSQFVRLAGDAIRKVQSLNKTPLVVGGTGLYIRALIDGLFDGPSRDENLRKRLEDEGKTAGWDRLYRRLQEIDPAAASGIPAGNHRRIVRALEVYELSGMPISSFQRQWKNPRTDVVMMGLERDKSDLRKRIDQRVDRMLAAGLVEEAKHLLEQGLAEGSAVMQAIGYKEIFTHLRGEISLDSARDLIKTNTRRFAKRQMTWFRKDKRIHWFYCHEDESENEIAGRLAAALGKMGIYT